MARIIAYGREVELPDGAPIMDACETLGVPFGCRSGICATCLVKVIDGAENLEPPNTLEAWMDLPPDERLACQAGIRGGPVTISW